MGLGVGVGISIGRDGGVAGNVPDAPTVTAPAAAADIYDGIAVTLTATVTAGQVPHKIEFLLDDTTVIASDSASPYSQSWTPSGVSAGAHTIKARFVYNYGTVTSAATNVVLFNPDVLTGNLVWLRADAGVTKDGSDKVSQWDDQSGNANHAVQADGAKQPTWAASVVGGMNGITGDGTADVMQITGIDLSATTGSTLLMVVKDSMTGTGVYFEQTGTGSVDAGLSVLTQDADEIQSWTKGSATAFKRALATGGARSSGAILSLRVDQTAAAAAEMQARQNGGAALALSWLNGETQESTANLGNSSYYLFGRAASNWLSGSICELVLYDSALSVANHQRVTAYLAARYGISITAVS